jgi:hypothetical protein
MRGLYEYVDEKDRTRRLQKLETKAVDVGVAG